MIQEEWQYCGITPLKFDHDWLTGIILSFEKKKYVILCVYMPCMNNSPEQEGYILQLRNLTAHASQYMYLETGMLISVMNTIYLGNTSNSFVMIQGSAYQAN